MIQKTCRHCLKVFESETNRQIYCSRSCFMVYRNSLREPPTEDTVEARRIRDRLYMRAYMRNKFHDDEKFRAKHLVLVKRRNRRNIAANKKIIAEFKAPGCAICGESDPCCISAHHVDQKTKDFPLSRNGGATHKVIAELQKCVPLCENCHRKVHAKKISLVR